jgi:hypothetical protein
MKKSISFVATFLFSLCLMNSMTPTYAESGGWDEKIVDQLVSDLQNDILQPSDPNERIDSPVLEHVFNDFKKLAVKLGQIIQPSVGFVRQEASLLINNIDTLSERTSADVTVDQQEKSAHIDYYWHINDKVVADELGLPQKWKVAEIEVAMAHILNRKKPVQNQTDWD